MEKDRQQHFLLFTSIVYSEFYIYINSRVVSYFYFRRLMIEKIATHISDFTPRLHSNVKALYQVRYINYMYYILDRENVEY